MINKKQNLLLDFCIVIILSANNTKLEQSPPEHGKEE
jgi:hypothetical protein